MSQDIQDSEIECHCSGNDDIMNLKRHDSWNPFDSEAEEEDDTLVIGHPSRESSSSLFGSNNNNKKDGSNKRELLINIFIVRNLRKLFQCYIASLKENPLLTKAITSSVIGALGAILGTTAVSSSQESASVGGRNSRNEKNNGIIDGVDWLEVISFAIHGGVIGGPINHYWNEWLSKKGPESNSMRMLVNQFFFYPPYILISFISLDTIRTMIQKILPLTSLSSASKKRNKNKKIIIHNSNNNNRTNTTTSSDSHYNNSATLSKTSTYNLQNIGSMIAFSWRFWPTSIYILLKLFKRKGGESYTVAMNICSLYWISRLANERKKNHVSLQRKT